MKKFLILSLFLCAAIFIRPALAEKGGNGHKPVHAKEQPAAKAEKDDKGYGFLFSREERDIISAFLTEERAKFCPPGLAKKNNGCMPPGQAKKYAVGHPLGKDVEFRDLPERLLKILSPRKGHRFVQVDEDILLIAEGTQLVVDAISLMNNE